jgi:hypothetical protein
MQAASRISQIEVWLKKEEARIKERFIVHRNKSLGFQVWLIEEYKPITLKF